MFEKINEIAMVGYNELYLAAATNDPIMAAIKKIATQIQGYASVIAFLAMVLLGVLMVWGPDRAKQVLKERATLIVGGIFIIGLAPQIANFIVGASTATVE